MAISQQPAPPARGFALDLRDGLTPVGLFAGSAIVTVALTALARVLFTPAGYDIQKPFELGLTAIGFISAIVLYIISVRRTWLSAKTLEEQGLAQRAQRLRWTLVAGSLLLLVPFLLGIVLPQHPAILGH